MSTIFPGLISRLISNNTCFRSCPASNYLGATLLVRPGVELRQVLEEVEG